MAELTIPGVVLTGELEERRKELEALNDRAHIMMARLTPTGLFWRPAEGSWSIGECVNHIAATNRGMLPGHRCQSK